MAALRPPLVGLGVVELLAGLTLSAWSVLTATGVLDARAGPSMPAFLPVALVVAALPAGLLLCGLGLRLLLRGLR